MKAKPNTQYAIISNGIVSEIFDSSKYPEWNEQQIQVIEINESNKDFIAVGLRANSDGSLTPPSLNELKAEHLNHLALIFEQQILELDNGLVSEYEKNTYDLQLTQAQNYIHSKDPKDAPFLEILAQKREIDLENLCQKIIEKNTAYMAQKAELLSAYQIAKDKVKAAKNINELSQIML